MDDRLAALEQAVPLAGLLGYLNFSDGRPDARWQRQLDDAFAVFAARGSPTPWRDLLDALAAGLERLHAGDSAAFRDVTQARATLELVGESLVAYRRYHADLLAHVSDADLFGPFFLARVVEAALTCRAEGDDCDAAAVVARLNDFVGYRPIAILETRPQGEPYAHEKTRPVPLFLRGAGVAGGRYRDVIARALDILSATSPDLLAEAQLDPELVDELAVDVRAYDFGHPAERRPNYVFGEWDPHHLDGQGRYRRYVVRQVTLDGLLERVEQAGDLPRDELLTEAAAVLAGTILMGAGVTGWGPGSYDSSTTLGTLLPRIVRYRDAFYEQLAARLPANHAERLRLESEKTRQPFGAARQHLNATHARRRALQLQQRHLALVYAEMGFPNAAREEAGRIPAVSVRLLSEALAALASGHLEAGRSELSRAAERLSQVSAILRRGIDCGAFVDPWNLLGFQGLFPLSPAREDTVRDLRVDELLHLVEQTFNLAARLMCDGAAAGEDELVRALRTGLKELAGWWDQFASSAVSDVRRVDGGEALASAAQVAKALARWRRRGEGAADLAFWRGHLDDFRSPKAFALVIDTLLRKGDFRAAMALLMCWLGQAEAVPLEDGAHSFPSLALRWMLTLVGGDDSASPVTSASGGESPHPTLTRPGLPDDRRALIVKFFDHLEANADEFWEVPTLESDEPAEAIGPPTEDLYGAAYEDMTYQDSTDDSDGAVADGASMAAPFDLEAERPRLEQRLRFLSALARLWQVAARHLALGGPDGTPLADWRDAARQRRRQLDALIDAIHDTAVPAPPGDLDSIVEYDHRRELKEHLLHVVIGTALDMSLAAGALQGALGTDESTDAGPPWQPFALRLERALYAGKADDARAALGPFLDRFRDEPLLFTPLNEGGAPRQVLRVRLAQTVLRGLLANLPRLGLLRDTYELLRAARAIEQAHPTTGRGVTEFNHFFQSAFQSVVESVVLSAADWPAEQGGDERLADLVETLTAPFLALWVEHSRTLHLSALESVAGDTAWTALRDFIRRYGRDLFDARFMTLANVRGILHRGVGRYLDHLRHNPDPLRPVRLADELDAANRPTVERHLETVLRAIVENFEEYRDYNTTTTQSDYGDNLHVLLDFLRLKALYDRHAWQFRPLAWAHEVLARAGRDRAAIRWHEQTGQLTGRLAQQHLDQLARLEQEHGARLGTIRDHLGEMFVKPLALDRLCALIEPAVAEARGSGNDRPAFARLREELRAVTQTPTGVGLDVPAWLRRLEAEVQRVQARRTTVVTLAESFFRVPRRQLAFDEVQREMTGWDRPALPS